MSKRFLFCFVFVIFTFSFSTAQLNEQFTDGDFSENPVWTGSSADWIVNSALQLQSNNTVTNSTFYIATPSTLAISAQWEFYLKFDFNPSSANYIDVYLTASSSDLSQAGATGYFVRVGNIDDEISLYRKDAGGTLTKIINGVNGVLNKSASTIKIKVIRDASNQWTLLRDLSGTGNTFTNEGLVTDATYMTSSFFGILIKQSTASF